MPAREPAGLTRRELEILRLVAEGRPSREVAKILWVTNQTIEFHLANAYRKLSVRTREEAIEWARIHGLFDPDDDSEGHSGLGGVREPRRPIKPTLSGSIALDRPDEHDTGQQDETRRAA
jgi:DNA-binding CsgD family transcriptional regulator